MMESMTEDGEYCVDGWIVPWLSLRSHALIVAKQKLLAAKEAKNPKEQCEEMARRYEQHAQKAFDDGDAIKGHAAVYAAQLCRKRSG